MDELVRPDVITAIADPEFEGLVSSAIFASGWDVVARPLDFKSLEDYLNENAGKNILIIYSVDLPGIDYEKLTLLSRANLSLLGFTDATGSPRGFVEVSQRPSKADEVMAFIRGNIRSYSIRAPLLQSRANFKSKIIGVGSAGTQSGTTTLALNLAQELSNLSKRTLLLDANFSSPAIADLLDLRRLAEEEKWRDVSEYLSVAEITQNNISAFPEVADAAVDFFDYIIFDLGSLKNIASDLSDRRWVSQVKIWVCRFSHEIFLTAGTDFLQRKRLSGVCLELAQTRLPARISIFMKPEYGLAKRELTRPVDCHPLFPERVQYLPFDLRLCENARAERTTLSDINEKAQLSKAIASVAVRITE